MHPSSSSKLYAHTLNALSGIHRAVMHTLLKSPLDLNILSHSHCVVQALTYAGGRKTTTTIRINRFLQNEFGDENSSLFLQRENLVNSLHIGATKNPFLTHTHTRHLSTSSQCQHYKIK